MRAATNTSLAARVRQHPDTLRLLNGSLNEGAARRRIAERGSASGGGVCFQDMLPSGVGKGRVQNSSKAVTPSLQVRRQTRHPDKRKERCALSQPRTCSIWDRIARRMSEPPDSGHLNSSRR